MVMERVSDRWTATEFCMGGCMNGRFCELDGEMLGNLAFSREILILFSSLQDS